LVRGARPVAWNCLDSWRFHRELWNTVEDPKPGSRGAGWPERRVRSRSGSWRLERRVVQAPRVLCGPPCPRSTAVLAAVKSLTHDKGAGSHSGLLLANEPGEPDGRSRPEVNHMLDMLHILTPGR